MGTLERWRSAKSVDLIARAERRARRTVAQMQNAKTWTSAQSEQLILEVRKFSWQTVYDRALHDELRRQDPAVPPWETFITALSNSPWLSSVKLDDPQPQRAVDDEV